jgi:hypothetical protein
MQNEDHIRIISGQTISSKIKIYKHVSLSKKIIDLIPLNHIIHLDWIDFQSLKCHCDDNVRVHWCQNQQRQLMLYHEMDDLNAYRINT